MTDRQGRTRRAETARRPILPAWLYVAGTMLAAAIAVAIVVSVTTNHPSTHALQSAERPTQHHVSTTVPTTPAATKAVHAHGPIAAKHDPLTSASLTIGSHIASRSETTTTATSTPSSSAPSVTSQVSQRSSAAATPPSTSSTTSTNPPSTTLTSQTVTETKITSGELAEPFLTTTIPFQTAQGSVNATATWSGGGTLHVALRCVGASAARLAASGTYLAVDARAGACSLTLSERESSDPVLSYNIAIDYQQLSG